MRRETKEKKKIFASNLSFLRKVSKTFVVPEERSSSRFPSTVAPYCRRQKVEHNAHWGGDDGKAGIGNVGFAAAEDKPASKGDLRDGAGGGVGVRRRGV